MRGAIDHPFFYQFGPYWTKAGNFEKLGIAAFLYQYARANID